MTSIFVLIAVLWMAGDMQWDTQAYSSKKECEVAGQMFVNMYSKVDHKPVYQCIEIVNPNAV